MYITIQYPELLSIAKQYIDKFKIENIVTTGSKSFHLDGIAEVLVPIIGSVSKHVPLDVKILQVHKNSILLQYSSGSHLVNLVGLLGIPLHLPSYIHTTENNMISIDLMEVAELQKMWKYVTLSDVMIENSGIKLTCEYKNP